MEVLHNLLDTLHIEPRVVLVNIIGCFCLR